MDPDECLSVHRRQTRPAHKVSFRTRSPCNDLESHCQIIQVPTSDDSAHAIWRSPMPGRQRHRRRLVAVAPWGHSSGFAQDHGWAASRPLRDRPGRILGLPITTGVFWLSSLGCLIGNCHLDSVRVFSMGRSKRYVSIKQRCHNPNLGNLNNFSNAPYN